MENLKYQINDSVLVQTQNEFWDKIHRQLLIKSDTQIWDQVWFEVGRLTRSNFFQDIEELRWKD